MNSELKFEKRSEELGRKLPAPLREFLDAVIVPALAREYRREKTLALSNSAVASFTAKTSSCEAPR